LGVEGIGFAIPVNLVRGVLNDIIAHGRVIRGWIGIVPQDVTEAQAKSLGLPSAGVLVSNLYVGSPAQQAGIQPGDILVAIDGAPLRSAQEALANIASRPPGTVVTIRALRGRQSINTHARVSEPPRNP
jgi:S1-C subfamily serine protease